MKVVMDVTKALLLAAFFCNHLLAGAALVGADEWTNLRGTSTVSGSLVGIWNGRVILKLSDGRQLSVKLDDLDATSRIQAEDKHAEIEKFLQSRVGELDMIAKAAAAPAPGSISVPTPAPAYVPPAAGTDLSTALADVQFQNSRGHFRASFDALPPSQQAQADQLFKLGLQKIDPSHWELFRATIQRLADVAVTKQSWLFSHPRMSSLGDGERESLLTLASAIRVVANADVASRDTLQAAPLADTIAKLDELLSPFLHDAIQNNPAMATLMFPNYEVETLADGKMVAKVVMPIVGTIQTVPMVQLEGRWVEGTTPEDAQAKWDGYKKSLDAVPNGSLRFSPQTDVVLNGLSSLLAQLETATSRNEFHRMVDAAAATMTPAINTWANVRPQPGSYAEYDDYNSGDYDSGESGMEAEMRSREAAARSQGGRP